MVNIFYTNERPEVCAKNLDNVRIVKMVTETMQILCGTPIRICFMPFGPPSILRD